jgi:tetratricopeptide (TPR) repeat protein
VPLPVVGDVDQLTQRLQVALAMQMHPSGAILDLEFEEWETLRAAAVQASRAETASEAEGHHATWLTPPVSDAAWHDARARDAEQDSDTFGANWHLDRLIQLQPDQWQHYARRGDALLQAGQVAEAAADFNQAAERLGAPAELLHWQSQKALDAQKRKQWPEALWYMTALIAAQPGDVELYVQRADVHEQQGHQTELVADLERAVELDAGVEVVRRLIDQRASLGQWEQAKELFGAVAPRLPGSMRRSGRTDRWRYRPQLHQRDCLALCRRPRRGSRRSACCDRHRTSLG